MKTKMNEMFKNKNESIDLYYERVWQKGNILVVQALLVVLLLFIFFFLIKCLRSFIHVYLVSFLSYSCVFPFSFFKSVF